MSPLKPATELAAGASRPYPNDSAEYRPARISLLAEQIELRRHIERVAAQRRALPPGGEARDYRFKDERGQTIGMAELFGEHDTLVTYFWMYGPERERPCPMCTAFLGSVDVPSRYISQRVAIAAIGRSPVDGDDFARDYRGLAQDGSEWPTLDVWTRRDGKVLHFWGSEPGGTADPGQDARGAPDPTPLWNILDLTPAGRGSDWCPKLSYSNAA